MTDKPTKGSNEGGSNDRIFGACYCGNMECGSVLPN